MASGAMASPFVLSPPSVFLFELLLGSTVVGLTPADSIARPLSLPLAWGCVHYIAKQGMEYLRPRWASLFGGASAMVFFQYLDLAVIRRWNYRDRGPALDGRALDREKKDDAPGLRKTASPSSTHTARDETFSLSGIWRRFVFGWNQMWALRHVDSPHEVRNVPHFSPADPSYVPGRGAFVLRESAVAAACYLVMDLMAQRPPPSPETAARLFDAHLIPFFRRLNAVTLPEIKLRALSIFGFALTFFCIVRGMMAAVGALAVGLGLSEPRSWRPQFGSVLDAYSVSNVWGKVWHQNFRSLVVSPAKKVTHDYLGLPHDGALGRAATLLLAFAVSGGVHVCAGAAAGMAVRSGSGVMQFFLTQALGIIVEESARSLYRRVRQYLRGEDSAAISPPPTTTNTITTIRGDKSDAKDRLYTSKPGPSPVQRAAGLLWVAAFMAWSGPAWLYPQAVRPPPPPVAGAPPQGFLPFSVVRMWRGWQAAAAAAAA